MSLEAMKFCNAIGSPTSDANGGYMAAYLQQTLGQTAQNAQAAQGFGTLGGIGGGSLGSSGGGLQGYFGTQQNNQSYGTGYCDLGGYYHPWYPVYVDRDKIVKVDDTAKALKLAKLFYKGTAIDEFIELVDKIKEALE